MIPVNTPLLRGNEKKYLIECIDSGWISSEGPFVKALEEKMATRVSRANGIAVCNGTAALDVAVEALGIGRGDEVILPSFTIISCVTQIVRSGAIPVFVDSEPDTWNMDLSQVEKKITGRTKAIMAVHMYGLPVDMDPLLEIADKHGLKVIEDASEAIGQDYKGRPCGSFGDISTLSFYPNKHVTTGEGGMVLTNDPEVAEVCRSLRNLCFKPERRFVHDRLGWNLRMTNLQAALGVAQLERLDLAIERKRAIGNKYQSLLEGLPNVRLPLKETTFAKNVYWIFGLVLDESVPFDAWEAMQRLGAAGIGCRPFFFPLHKQPVFEGRDFFRNLSLPVSENLGERGFYIPSGLGLTDEEIEKVAREVRRCLG